MARTTITVTCPHCEAAIEVRIATEAAVAPALRLPFSTEEEFAQWLKASGLSIDEFKRLPFYEWHRDELEALTRAVAASAEPETVDEWHRDQLEPLTRSLTDAPEDRGRTQPQA
jgi:hypothetical protein